MSTFDSLSYCSSITGISGLQGNAETMSYSSAPDPSASGTNSGSSVPEPSDKSFSSLSKKSDHESLGHDPEEFLKESVDRKGVVIVEGYQNHPSPSDQTSAAKDGRHLLLFYILCVIFL